MNTDPRSRQPASRVPTASEGGSETSHDPRPRFVPLGRPEFVPLVTYGLLGLSVLVFLGQLAGQYAPGRDLLTQWGRKDNFLIAQGQYWRLITPIFLHGSLLHIGFNMYALFLFGPGLERHYGRARYLALYLLSGFAGNVASLTFSPAPSLGSSTAIFGLLGAQGVFMFHNRELLGGAARRGLNNIIAIAVINLLVGLSPQIDNWGHLGGLLGGGFFAWFGGPLLRLEGIYPAYTLTDQREPASVVLAAAMTGLLFAAAAAGVIFLRA